MSELESNVCRIHAQARGILTYKKDPSSACVRLCACSRPGRFLMCFASMVHPQPKCLFVCMCLYTRMMFVHAQLHADEGCTYIHTYIHAYMHTCIHTHMDSATSIHMQPDT